MDEPAADLAVAVALISGYTDRAVGEDMIFFGEIGLAGEVRAVSHADARVNEAARLGFKRIYLPKRNLERLSSKPKDATLCSVSSIHEIAAMFIAPAKNG